MFAALVGIDACQLSRKLVSVRDEKLLAYSIGSASTLQEPVHCATVATCLETSQQ